MLPQNEKASKRSCLVLSILLFVVLPFSVLILGLVLWYGRESSGRSQLKARIASIIKQGYPVDDASVDRYYKDRTDAANTEAWLAVLNTMTSQDFTASTNGVAYLGMGTEAEVPILPEEEWNDEEVSLAFLEKWESLHAEVLRLSIDAKPVRFPIDFDSFATILQQTQQMRQAARLLQLRGRVGLRNRDSAVVRDAIDGMLGVSRVNAGEPILVSQLVSIAIDGMALGLLKDSLKVDVLSEADLQSLLPKVMATINIGKEWEMVVAGERALALPVFVDPKKARTVGVTSVPGRSRDAIFYLDLIQGVIELPTDNLEEFKIKLKDAQAKTTEKANANWITRFDSILTLQTTPAFAAAGDAFIRRALQHRMAALAIGLRLYEDRHGKFPNSLKDLSDLPMDVNQLGPTQERSFGYRLEGSDAKLWGGSFQDAFAIPAEPPVIVAGEPDTTMQEFWSWDLPAKKKGSQLEPIK